MVFCEDPYPPLHGFLMSPSFFRRCLHGFLRSVYGCLSFLTCALMGSVLFSSGHLQVVILLWRFFCLTASVLLKGAAWRCPLLNGFCKGSSSFPQSLQYALQGTGLLQTLLARFVSLSVSKCILQMHQWRLPLAESTEYLRSLGPLLRRLIRVCNLSSRVVAFLHRLLLWRAFFLSKG